MRLLGIAPDEAEPLRRVVVEALGQTDALVTSGGVSVGTHDLVKPLLESLGTVYVGRVKLKPGKPFTFATLSSRDRGEGQKVAFGLPGFPVSSLVTFEVFVRPALRKMQGFAKLHRPTLPVRLGYDARPTADRTEYQRVTLRREGRAGEHSARKRQGNAATPEMGHGLSSRLVDQKRRPGRAPLTRPSASGFPR